MSLTLTLKDNGGNPVSGEGTSITINNTTETNFTKFDLYGDTDQTTYSGVQLVTKQGLSTPTSDTAFWNTISSDISFTPLTDGWGRYIQTNSSSSIYGNLYANYSAVDLELDTDYTIIFEFKNVTATSGQYDVGQRTASADPFETLAAISGCTYNGTNIGIAMNGSNTFAVFKGHTRTSATSLSIRTFTRPNFPQGKGFDVRVSYIKGDHTNDWQNYCGDNYQPYVGGMASPNPDYPQEVNVVTGEQTITVSNGQGESQVYPINLGKNLVNIPDFHITGYGLTADSVDGVITVTGTCSSGSYPALTFYADGTVNLNQYWASTGRIDASKGYFTEAYTDYMLSTFVEGSSQYTVTGAYETTAVNIIQAATGSGSSLVNRKERLNCFSFGFSPSEVVNVTIKLQIEKGSSATTYAPYFTPIELCEIGDYQDYIYKSGEDWYIHKEIATKTYVGASGENWTYFQYGGYSIWRSTNVPTGMDTSSITSDSFKSNNFTYWVNDGTSVSVGVTDGHFGFTATANNINFKYLAVEPTLSDWTTWLSNHPTTVYYPLATPTDTQITDENLIEQLNELWYNAHAYKGTTNLASTAEDLPHIMSVEVAKNNDATVINSGNTIAKPVMTIYGSGNITLSLNGYQMFNIALGDEQYITLDIANMEAYKDTTDNLKNRLVDGDYNNFALQTGENQITFSGTVTKFEISNYSRWI